MVTPKDLGSSEELGSDAKVTQVNTPGDKRRSPASASIAVAQRSPTLLEEETPKVKLCSKLSDYLHENARRCLNTQMLEPPESQSQSQMGQIL